MCITSGSVAAPPACPRDECEGAVSGAAEGKQQ